MECPACGKTLSQLALGDITVDACKEGCGGVWFDHNEIVKFDEPHEFQTSEILTLAKEKQAVRIDHAKRKPCPKCAGETLVRQFFDVKNEVEIDQCWNCAGIWLDTGEINAIRAQYKSYEDRERAVNAYVDTQLKQAADELAVDTDEQLQRYNAETQNRLRAFVYGFKKLLGLDDLYDNL